MKADWPHNLPEMRGKITFDVRRSSTLLVSAG